MSTLRSFYMLGVCQIAEILIQHDRSRHLVVLSYLSFLAVDHSGSNRPSPARQMQEPSGLTTTSIMQKTKRVQTAAAVSRENCALCLPILSLLGEHCKLLTKVQGFQGFDLLGETSLSENTNCRNVHKSFQRVLSLSQYSHLVIPTLLYLEILKINDEITCNIFQYLNISCKSAGFITKLWLS